MFSSAQREVRAEIDGRVARIAPIFEPHLGKGFDADQTRRRDLIGDPGGLLQDPGGFRETVPLPFRFDDTVVDERDRSEVLLEEQFALQFEELVGKFHLAVKGGSDPIRVGVGEVVDAFDREVMKRLAESLVDPPIGEINSQLGVFGDAEFHFVPEFGNGGMRHFVTISIVSLL